MRIRTHWKGSLARLLTRCVLGAVIFHTSQPVCAQPGPARAPGGVVRPDELPVTRALGAERCPDGAALAARVAGVQGAPAAMASPYRVDFTQEGGLYTATIRRLDDDQLTRVLSARGDSCDPLAKATSVTLALLLDALAAKPTVEPTPEIPAAPAAAGSAPVVVSVERGEKPVQLQGALGGAALLGVTRDAAPALLGELAFTRGPVRVGLGALWVPPMRTDFGPGSLRSTLWSGALRACYAAYRTSPWQLALCGGFMAGAIEVSARGYTRNERDSRAWLAVPVELAASYRPGTVAIRAGLGALFPVLRHDFSIDGLGPGYASWPIAALFSLQVVAAFPSSVEAGSAKN